MLNYRRSTFIRFFGKRRGLRTPTQGEIDSHHSLGEQHSVVESTTSSNVRRGAPYLVRGWAIDIGRKRTPWDILVEVDGRVVAARTQLGLARPDIADTYGPDLLLSGFTATFGTGSLAPGPHDLTIRAIVGRRGAAHAKIASTIRFFVLDSYPAALPRHADLPTMFRSFHIEPVSAVLAGSVCEVTGWAVDERGAPITGVAAQIDDNRWHEGSTNAARPGGFCVPIPLDAVEAGVHQLRLAGKARDGRWGSLGQPTQMLVTAGATTDTPWARPLVDSGQAQITDANGRPLTQIVLYRNSAAVTIKGTLRRSTPVGVSVTLVAQADDDTEVSLPAWSAPTDDPTQIQFGASLSADDLPPNTYRLFIDGPDASRRFTGRSDPRCTLVVRPNAERGLGRTGRP